MIQFYHYDLIVIPGIIQGVFLATFLYKNNNNNRSANRILIWILLLAVFMLIGRMVWLRYPPAWPVQISLLADTTIFLFGPLFFFYIKRLLYETNKPKIPFYHFIPACIHFVKTLYYLTLTKTEFLDFLQRTGYEDYLLTEEIAIVLNLIYWIAGYRLITKYKKKEKDQISYNQNLVVFLKYFQLTIICCLVIWLVSFIGFIMYRPIPIFNYDSVWIIMSLFTYLVGYFNLKQPELFRVSETSSLKKKSVTRMSEEEIESLTNRLEESMTNEKPFLNSHLTLVELAKKLNTSPNNLSWLLNEVHGKNFYDYINQFRIAEFKEKVSNREHTNKTILALATEVGFKSKSTFNKYFQLEVREAPSRYIKKFSPQEV